MTTETTTPAPLDATDWTLDGALRQRWREQDLHGTHNLGTAFELAAQQWPEAPLVFDRATGVEHWTLGQLHDTGLRLAQALHGLGLRAGEVLAVQLPNGPEGLLLQRAAAALGAVYLPIVPIYGPAELAHILKDASARLWVAPAHTRHGPLDAVLAAMGPLPALRQVIAVGKPESATTVPGTLAWHTLLLPHPATDTLPPNPVGPDDVALLIYTSGTTGAPKGVQHSANSLQAENRSVALRRLHANTAQLSPWPTGHIAGLVTGLEHALRGRPTVLMEAWDPVRAARLIEAHRIVASSGTPFHLVGLLDAAQREGIDIGTLQDYLTGAASVSSALVQRCAERGIVTYRAYGLSEHPTLTIGNVHDSLDSRLHTEGSLTAGNELRLVDDAGRDVPPGTPGELAVRGPERFLGYRDPAMNAGAFLPGGWFLTGDIGHLDTDGFLHLTDRKKDIVNRGGEKIASREVENAMLLLPGVQDVAVVAMPDERLGEQVCAFVVWQGEAAPLAAVDAHFRALGLARQKTPEHLVGVAELPRNATGKVLKHLLREQLRQQPPPR